MINIANIKKYNELLKRRELDNFSKGGIFKYFLIMTILITFSAFLLFSRIEMPIMYISTLSFCTLALLKSYQIEMILFKSFFSSFIECFTGIADHLNKYKIYENRSGLLYGVLLSSSFALFSSVFVFAFNLSGGTLIQMQTLLNIMFYISSFFFFVSIIRSLTEIFIYLNKYNKHKAENRQQQIENEINLIEIELNSDVKSFKDLVYYNSLAQGENYALYEIDKMIDKYYEENDYKTYDECVIKEKEKKNQVSDVEIEIENI